MAKKAEEVKPAEIKEMKASQVHEILGKYINKVMFDELLETLNLPKDELKAYGESVVVIGTLHADRNFAADGVGLAAAGCGVCAGGLGICTCGGIALCRVGWGSEPALQCLGIAPGACRAVGL